MRGDLLPRVISSESEKSFSLAVKKKRESIGKRETPYSIRFEITSFHSGRKSERATKKRPQLHLGGRYGKCSLPIPFYSAARANLRSFGAPPSIGRRESRIPAPKPFPCEKEAMQEYRFLVPSFRAKARNLFRWRSRRNVRASENGKRRTPYAPRSRCFIRAGKSERLTKKRPQLHLGGRYGKMLLTHSFLFRCESQPPPLRGTSFHRKEGEPHPRTKAFPA